MTHQITYTDVSLAMDNLLDAIDATGWRDEARTVDLDAETLATLREADKARFEPVSGENLTSWFVRVLRLTTKLTLLTYGS